MAEPLTASKTAVDQELPKRRITLTRKALKNAIDTTRRKADNSRNKLQSLIHSLEQRGNYDEKHLHALEVTTEEYRLVVHELACLYEQDSHGEYNLDEALLAEEQKVINYAYMLVRKKKNLQSDELSETSRHSKPHSRHSRSRSSVSTGSSVRLRALAEAAAAQENAEYERLIAEKELERSKREAEHAKELAVLSANKKAAVANAKLRAIENAIREEETPERVEIPGIPNVPIEERTRTWVHTQQESEGAVDHNKSKTAIKNVVSTATNLGSSPQRALGQPFVASTPLRDETGTQLIDTLTSTNRQIVAGLARQSLPKCHPDTYGGDATLFHPWKKAFQAMIRDADVSAEQEINYIRSFTNGEVQRVVDNFRKRQLRDPVALLRDLWKELERRFGSTAVITNVLLERLREASAFGNHDNAKLQEFADLCADVNSQLATLPGLACLNYPNAIWPIAERLPAPLRAKWEKEVATYAEKNQDAYPGFDNFAQLINRHARTKNHPNIMAGSMQTPGPMTTPRRRETPVSRRTFTTNTRMAETKPEALPKEKLWCRFHERDGHDLTECKAFTAKSLREKTEFIQKARLCFLCLTDGHQAKDCRTKPSCDICGDNRHITLLHKDKDTKTPKEMGSKAPADIGSKCTAVCRESGGGVSCSKIMLVDVSNKNKPDNKCRVYAIIDDQSNTSLISSELADMLGADGPEERYYLTTCSSDKEVKYGRRVTGLVARSAVNGKQADLPTLVECDRIPEDVKEIPTPEIARRFLHLQGIANEIPAFDQNAGTHILLGRDAPELLKVRAFKNGPRGAPWAQELLLGWTVTGQVCFDRLEGPIHIQARRTSVKVDSDIPATTSVIHTTDSRGRAAVRIDGEEYDVIPCPNQLQITDSLDVHDVFHTSPRDNEPSLSCDDRKFLQIMENGVHKNASGNWEMPLPFRQQDAAMPNNRSQAAHRLNGLLKTLKRKPQMQKDYLEFMEKVIVKGHASPVPPGEIQAQPGRIWYLPHFGVYHPRKPTQIRVVFDSSAEFKGVSLNKELLAGPDLMNSLLGVLIRFRKENVAVMCDIEQMFHSFHVDPAHRNYLRFLWFQDNDPEKPVAEYRMNVHLFGNGPSPAVATYGLRETVAQGEEEYGEEVVNFVRRNFYVDDGLASLPTAQQAVRLVRNTQAALATSNLRLHKVVSNSIDVMEAFPMADRAKDVRDLDLRSDSLPAQRSLGVYWNLENDAFTFRVSLPEKPFTRRGVLSVVNSVYDPLGLAVPVMLEGRKLLQQLVVMGKRTSDNTPLAWDDPLPEKLAHQWLCWKNSLQELQDVSVPRCYKPKDFGPITRAEIHAFSDASQEAIGASVYLRLFNEAQEVTVSFVYGQAKLAPVRPTSIPRLELCGAVLVTQAVQRVLKEIDMDLVQVTYYTDSKVVLGYITNESKRFYVYVANRVQQIRSISSPHQWRYVKSEYNPADQATRGIQPSKLMQSTWLNGPDFLRTTESIPPPSEIAAPSENDPEVRKEVITTKTKIDGQPQQGLGADRFERFSSFSSLRHAIAILLVKVREFKRRINDKGRGAASKSDAPKEHNSEPRHPTAEDLEQATTVIVCATQEQTFSDELQRQDFTATTQKQGEREQSVARKKALKGSHLYQLDPFIDSDGVLRVGGRLRRAKLVHKEKHPVLLPKNHHISRLIVRHYHEQCHHQGRQITHGAVRQAGYWLIGGHRLVAKELGSCVPCKKLRGPPLTQRMADLPADRTEVGPPFTNVGFDVFGPWSVQTRKMRGGAANSKRWGLVLTCLSSRAVHIEVLESMDTSAFICALRRFFALRGPAAIVRCDRGTNFVGAKSELDGALKSMDRRKIERFIAEQGCEWKFNPPHASHFGGAWERQIGTIRRVLDAMLAELGKEQLTHELLVTLMAEVTAIVNARPIAAVPSDADDPFPLSPAMLLNMKTRPLGPPPGDFVPADLYARRRWKRVQYLADQFWLRWRREYLQNLQTRQKWSQPQRNLANGDVVLVKDEGQYRNDWPLGRVTEAIESDDGRVRKVTVTVLRDGKRKTMLRPIKELVLLVPTQSHDDTSRAPGHP